MFTFPPMSTTRQRLSRLQIDRIAEQVMLYYDPLAMERRSLPMDAVEEGLKREGIQMIFNERLGVNSHGKKILGRFDVDSWQIWIDKSLRYGSPAFRWALAHEIGHFFLHRKVDPQSVSHEGPAFVDTNQELHFIRSARWSEAKWIEFQANQFASSLLLPIYLLTQALVEIQVKLGIPKAGRIYLDDQPCNLRDYARVMPKLMERFKVPRNVLYIRLETSGELIEARRAAKDHVQNALRSFFLESQSRNTRLAA